MSTDEFDLRKTGRFRLPTPAEAEPGEREDSPTSSPPSEQAKPKEPSKGAGTPKATQGRPGGRPGGQAPSADPHFDRRKTQLFVRAVGNQSVSASENDPASEARDRREATSPLSAETETETKTDDLENTTTGRFHRKDLLKD